MLFHLTLVIWCIITLGFDYSQTRKQKKANNERNITSIKGSEVLGVETSFKYRKKPVLTNE